MRYCARFISPGREPRCAGKTFSMLLTLLLVLEVIVAFFLIVVVLLQRSEGGGFVSGGTGSLMSVRGAGDLLTRTTWILASIFFALGLLLTIVAGRERGASSVADRLNVRIDPAQLQQQLKREQQQQQQQQAPAAPTPTPLQAPTPGLANPFGAPPPAQPTPAQPAAPATK
jgi:preprotein translocase subunit SecG